MKRVVLAFCLLTGGAQAAPRTVDPDWPCQQVKVGELSVAAFWTGPRIDLSHPAWRDDGPTARLVADTVQRRMPIDEAARRIAAFAKRDGVDRAAALAGVFAGLFTELNAERESVISGLDRFGQRQKALAESLRVESEALRTAQAATPGGDDPKVADLTQRLTWDVQLFETRRQSLAVACNVPNVIEQRLYALSKAIQQSLE